MNLPASFLYILPPVVGAGIGLFTNWLAIKMLFRPLRESRVLGIRVPFTPGILPRERRRIASSLGETVAIDILDLETVAARLRSPGFKDAIRKAALGLSRKALEARPSDIISGIDSEVVESLRPVLVRILSSITSSEAFKSAVLEGTGAALEEAHELPLSSLVDTATINTIASFLSQAQGARRLGDGLSGAIMDALLKAAKDGKRLSSFIGPKTLDSLATKAVLSGYPILLDALDGFLADKAIVASMEKAGARIIRKTLDRFNSVQRFFIGLGQYDKAIIENMPATIADFSDALGGILREASTKRALSEGVCRAMAKAAEKPLIEFGFLSDPTLRSEAQEALSSILSDAIMAIEPETLSSVVNGLLGGHTIGDILDVFPLLSGKLAASLSQWAANLVGPARTVIRDVTEEAKADGNGASPGTAIAKAFFGVFSQSFSKHALDLPLGDTVDIDAASLDLLASAIASALSELIVAESANMLESIDIRSLVVDKIDSLDMIEVERMILRVVDKELRAITMFGGILGAIIGLFQSLLFFLR